MFVLVVGFVVWFGFLVLLLFSVFGFGFRLVLLETATTKKAGARDIGV